MDEVQLYIFSQLQQNMVVSREYLDGICFCISILDYFTEDFRNLTVYATEKAQFMELSPTSRSNVTGTVFTLSVL